LINIDVSRETDEDGGRNIIVDGVVFVVVLLGIGKKNRASHNE
jgi:hypothetical protein